jgi:hypothetical protein
LKDETIIEIEIGRVKTNNEMKQLGMVREMLRPKKQKTDERRNDDLKYIESRDSSKNTLKLQNHKWSYNVSINDICKGKESISQSTIDPLMIT